MSDIVCSDTQTTDLAAYVEAFRAINRYVFKAGQDGRSFVMQDAAFIAKCYVEKRMIGAVRFEAGEEIRPAGFFPLDNEPTFIFAHGNQEVDLQKKRATFGLVELGEFSPDFNEEIKTLLVRLGYTRQEFLKRSRDFLKGKPLTSIRLTALLQTDVLGMIEEVADAAAQEKHDRESAKKNWDSL